jgi:hypothetical protein
MRHGMKGSLLAVLGVAGALGVAWMSSTVGDSQASRPARIDGHPNFSGIWQALNEANWDLEPHAARAGMITQVGVHADALVPAAPVLALGAVGAVPGSRGVIVGDVIPYQPWAAAQKRDNAEHWLDRDPEVKCFLAGIPRSMYMPHPFQIVQGANKVEMVFSYNSSGRTIHLDKVEPPPDDTYNGFSQGRWEGDTLVTEVTHFNGKTWLDRAGNFSSDALKVTERFTPIGSLDDMLALQYEATIEDPKVLTGPFTIRMPLYRRVEPTAQLMEFRCIEFVEELMMGHVRRNQLVTKWEGLTLDVEIKRKVPSDPDVLYQRDYVPTWPTQ